MRAPSCAGSRHAAAPMLLHSDAATNPKVAGRVETAAVGQKRPRRATASASAERATITLEVAESGADSRVCRKARLHRYGRGPSDRQARLLGGGRSDDLTVAASCCSWPDATVWRHAADAFETAAFVVERAPVAWRRPRSRSTPSPLREFADGAVHGRRHPLPSAIGEAVPEPWFAGAACQSDTELAKPGYGVTSFVTISLTKGAPPTFTLPITSVLYE